MWNEQPRKPTRMRTKVDLMVALWETRAAKKRLKPKAERRAQQAAVAKYHASLDKRDSVRRGLRLLREMRFERIKTERAKRAKEREEAAANKANAAKFAKARAAWDAGDAEVTL